MEREPEGSRDNRFAWDDKGGWLLSLTYVLRIGRALTQLQPLTFSLKYLPQARLLVFTLGNDTVVG